MVSGNKKTLRKSNLKSSAYKKIISIFFACLIVLIGVIFTTGILLFAKKEDIHTPKMIAYFYNGEQHDAPPSKERYEIDVVHCDKALGKWDNIKWNLTLTNIEGRTTCILNFKKRLFLHALSIDPNGGTYKGTTGISTFDVMETKTLQLDVPTRKGYTFAGWEVSNESSRVSGNIFTMGEDNTTITATWNINSYQIEIRDSYTCDKTENAEYNSVFELCEPIQSGYTFIRWETTSGTLDGNSLIVSDSNAMVTAKWQVNDYDYIVLHKQEGLNGTYAVADTETYSAPFDTEVSPETKTYDGFTSPEQQTFIIDIEDNVLEYEYTRNSYNLTINPMGGTTTSTLEQRLKYQESVTVDSPVKWGYDFTHWTYDSGVVQDEIFTMGASDTVLTANYSPKHLTLYFDANQGNVSVASKPIVFNSQYGELPIPTRVGYVFDGWHVAGVRIDSTSIVDLNESTSAVAHWKKQSYTLTINPNGGTYNSSSSIYEDTMEFEETKVIEEPVKEGFSFSGWTVEGTGATFDSSTNTLKIGPSNATLTATWTANNYRLTVADTNVCDGDYNLDYQEVYPLCTPEREGYTFVGWDDPNDIINNNVAIMRAKDSTIRAKWQINNYDYIVYHNRMDVNGTSYTKVDGDTYNGSDEYGTVVTTFAKSYVGFKSLDNKLITIGVDTSTPPEKNIANYDYERNKYALTIDPNGGTYSGSTTITLYYNETVSLSAPTKTGYDFSNWSKVGNAEIEKGILTMKTENTTLTANYTPKKYTVYFDAAGGSVTPTSKQVEYKSTYGELPTPIRTGYNFLGWYTAISGGTKIETFTTVTITGSQTLYAHWELQQYSVTLKTGSSTSFTTSTGTSTTQTATGTETVVGEFGVSTVSADGISTLSLSGNNKTGTTGLITPGKTVTVYTPFTITPTSGYTFSTTSTTERTYDTFSPYVTFSGITGTKSGFTYTFTMPNNNVTINSTGSYTTSSTNQNWTISSYSITNTFDACAYDSDQVATLQGMINATTYKDSTGTKRYYSSSHLEQFPQGSKVSLKSKTWGSKTISASITVRNGGANYNYTVSCSNCNCTFYNNSGKKESPTVTDVTSITRKNAVSKPKSTWVDS